MVRTYKVIWWKLALTGIYLMVSEWGNGASHNTGRCAAHSAVIKCDRCIHWCKSYCNLRKALTNMSEVAGGGQ